MTWTSPNFTYLQDGIVNTSARIILKLGVLILILILVRMVTEESDRQGAEFYRAMAESPTTFTASPWGYRLFVPTVVHFLPFSIITSFTIITYLALSGSALIIWELIRHLGYSIQAQIGATSLVIFSFHALHYSHNVAHVDPVTMLLLSAALPAVYFDRYKWVVLLTIILAFNREIAVYVPVLYFVVWYGRVSMYPLIIYSGLLLGFALVILGFLRSDIIFTAELGMEDYVILDNLRNIWTTRLEDPFRIIFQLWWIFNFAWFAGFLGLMWSSPSIRRLSVLIAFVSTPAIVAANWIRLIGLGVPVVAVFAAIAIEKLNGGNGLRDRSSVAALFIVTTNALVIFLGTEELAVRPASLILYSVLLGLGVAIWWPSLPIPARRAS